MGTHEAAKRLALYLEVLNSYVENGRTINERVALEVIRNLGKIGDRVAFDHVLYTRYLDYSRSVKQAAQEVLQDLRE
jgi:ectoine hydroxylase-related dioxygenase (phytanoyl-CoA dioxygenase family)